MKKQERTPKSRIRAAIRQLWLRSRERAAAMKRDGYICQKCSKKQSRAKGKEVYVQVHHKKGINWDFIIQLIYEQILIDPAGLTTLCKECHKKQTDRQRKKR